MRNVRLVMFCAAFRAARALLRPAQRLRPGQPPRLQRCASAAAKGDDLASLEKELERHDDLYYNQAKPELTDEAYDALARKVDELRTAPRSVGAKRGAVTRVENEQLLCDARVLVVRRRPGVPPGGRP